MTSGQGGTTNIGDGVPRAWSEPRRFKLAEGSKISTGEYLGSLYGKLFMSHITRGGHSSRRTINAVLADPDVKDKFAWIAMYAANVIPEPAPDAAVLGIVLSCWRNTDLEQIHEGSHELVDVLMAKLNISATRAVRPFVTETAIDWAGVRRVLLDGDRALPDGRTVGQLVGPRFQEVTKSFDGHVSRWERIQDRVGPEATVAMVSVVGSSGYTDHWWGTSWWPKLAKTVFDHVLETAPEIIGTPSAEQADRWRQMLIDEPDHLPDAVLEPLIHRPGGKGLSFGEIERPNPIIVTAPAHAYPASSPHA